MQAGDRGDERHLSDRFAVGLQVGSYARQRRVRIVVDSFSHGSTDGRACFIGAQRLYESIPARLPRAEPLERFTAAPGIFVQKIAGRTGRANLQFSTDL